LLVYILDQLLYYFNSYPYGTKDYPANILAAVATDPLALREALKQSAALLETALQLAERCRPADRAGLLPAFILECERIRSVARGVLDATAALADYVEARARSADDPPAARALLGRAAHTLRTASEEVLRVMGEMARVKPAYLAPAALREVSYLASFLHELAGELGGLAAEEEAGRLTELPQLPIIERIGESRLRAMWHPWEF